MELSALTRLTAAQKSPPLCIAYSPVSAAMELEEWGLGTPSLEAWFGLTIMCPRVAIGMLMLNYHPTIHLYHSLIIVTKEALDINRLILQY